MIFVKICFFLVPLNVPDTVQPLVVTNETPFVQFLFFGVHVEQPLRSRCTCFKGKSHGALELNFSALYLDSIDRLLHSQGGARGDQEEEGDEAKKPHILQDWDVDLNAVILDGGPLGD